MGTIHERLKEARNKANLSITKASKITGISEGNLSELESGAHKPSTNALLRFSEAYRVSTDWLLLGESRLPYIVNERNRELLSFLERIHQEWETADEATRGWMIVQLRKAFPEIWEQVVEDIGK